MKKTFFLASAVIIVLAGALFITSCFGHGPHSKSNMEDKMEFIIFKVTKELDLTDSQQELLKNSIAEIHAEKEKLHKDKNENFEEIKKMIKSDYVTEEQLQEFAEKKHENMEVMKDLIIKKIVEFHATLSPEQKDQAVKLLEKHIEKFNK